MGAWYGLRKVAIMYLMLIFFDWWSGNRILGPGFLIGIPIIVLVISLYSWFSNRDN